VAEIAEGIEAAWSKNTRRAYKAALRKLDGWVRVHHPEAVRHEVDHPYLGVIPLHTATLMDFLQRVTVPTRSVDGRPATRLAATSTLSLYLVAIRSVHRDLDLPDPSATPAFIHFWKGLQNRRVTDALPKRAARWPLVKSMVDAIEVAAAAGIRPWADRRILARDTALLLVGFAGAFRRSELVGLRRADVALPAYVGESVVLTLRRSKTSRRPTEVEIPYRADSYSPADRLLRWLEVVAALPLAEKFKSGTEAPVWFGFRGRTPVPKGLSAGSVAMIVKRAAQQAGLSPDQVRTLSAHSLRSGAATSAAEAGEPLTAIKDLGRWKGLDMVDRYVQRKHLGRAHPISRME